MSDRTPEQRAADRREIEKLHPGERFQMMMDASDTPETDEQVFIATPESEDLMESMDVVTADFARRLERERDDARTEAASFKEKEMGAVVIMSAEHRDYLEGIESERDQLRARVAELEAELKEVTEKRNTVLQRLLEKSK